MNIKRIYFLFIPVCFWLLCSQKVHCQSFSFEKSFYINQLKFEKLVSELSKLERKEATFLKSDLNLPSDIKSLLLELQIESAHISEPDICKDIFTYVFKINWGNDIEIMIEKVICATIITRKGAWQEVAGQRYSYGLGNNWLYCIIPK
ncbi:MAG: hypothetical protein V4548_00015 [Bacteroidota bacterium]